MRGCKVAWFSTGPTVELRLPANYRTIALIASSDNSRYAYVGWIPTANGRLSFRHIGETRHPTPSKYANVATTRDRIVLAYQRRNLSDSVFRTITDRVSSRSGDFWFAVSARSTAAP